jgi:copper transport protein
MTTLRRVGLIALICCAWVALAATGASAHAALVSSNPADGAQLTSAPTEVTMTFSETPDPTLSLVHVLTTTGAFVESGSVQGQSLELRIALKSGLPPGVYTVSWRVVSAQDGHVTAGAFAFGVGVQPGGTAISQAIAVPTPGPSVLSVIGKLLLYSGLTLMLGAAVTGLWAFGGEVPSRQVILIASGLAAVAGASLMLLAERATVGVSLSKLLSSQAGHQYEWLVGTSLAAEALAVVAALRETKPTLALTGGGAAGVMLARAIGGHAAAGSLGSIQVGIQWLHFLSVGAWVGGFLPVYLMVRRSDKQHTAAPVAGVRRYSTQAAVALYVVVATGVVRALYGMGLHGVLHILSTPYGKTLAFKLVLAAALVALGAMNRYRSIPGLDQGSRLLRRTLSLEVFAAVGVFALTGVLTGFAPKPDAAGAQARIDEIVASGSDVTTTVKVRLVVAPGFPGLNTYQLTPTEYDTGAPIQAVSVSLRFQPVGRADVAASMAELKPGSGGTWVGKGTELSIQGSWDVTVVIQMASRGIEVPLTLKTRAPPEQISVNRQAGQPDLYTITLPGGIQLQAYNDPGASGPNQLHLTAFDAAGKELPLIAASFTVTSPSGVHMALIPRRFSAGHFVASATYTPGTWHFELDATTTAGTSLVASFDQSFG